MQNTSQKFKDAIYAPTRSAKARVTFDISDQTANGDVSSITTTSDSPLSVKTQLINKVRSSTNKTATLEQDRFKLDGSFSFPDDTIANNGELGWSSAVICDSNGSFTPTDTLNFVGKISGSVVENGNISKYTKSAVLVAPSGTWDGEVGVAGLQYSNISVLDGSSGIAGGSVNTRMTQMLFSFDLIAHMYRKYGLVVDVPWLKANVTSLTANIWCSGSSPTGNKANFARWKSSSSSYATAINHTTSAITNLQLSYSPFTSTLISVFLNESLDSNGFVHFICYADPSNGTTASTINTDYVELLVTVNLTQTITFNFTSNHSSAGLTVTFDQSTGEYATDFDMTAYDSVGAVIDTVSVTGNTNIIATPLGQLYNYRKVSVTIKKWSVPYRRARVFEVDFGIVKQYTDDNLISMNLIEQMDMLSGQLPSAEFRFAVDNSDRAFNILNPDGFYKYLQQKQQVIGELGLDVGNGVIEYVQVGNYLLQEWQSDEGSLTASFTARTNLDSMASFDYEGSYVYNQSLYDYAVAIFGYCGISNFSIDPALKLINTNSLNKKMNCRDILQMIAIAGCANIFVTRGNIITLKCNPTLIGAPVDTADFDNMYNEPQITLDKAVKRVEVTYWSNLSTSVIVGMNNLSGNNLFGGNFEEGTFDASTGAKASYATALRTVNKVRVAPSKTYSLKNYSYPSLTCYVWQYDESGTCIVGQIVVSSSFITNANTSFINFVFAEQNPPVLNVNVMLNLGDTLLPFESYQEVTLGDTLKLENNTLINNGARATAVANWFFAQLKYRATYKVNWRGNPATELNDVLSLENSYGGNMSAYVTRNELDYVGYLKARTEAKGVVN